MSKTKASARRYLPPEAMGNPRHCVSASVEIVACVPQERLFDWFIDLDISRVLNGYGPLPAVIKTSEQTGTWDSPGSRRTLEMSGSISAVQEILATVRPRFFAYRVTGFTHLLNWIAHGAEARWWFEQVTQTQTRMRWNYTFWPRSGPGKLAIYFVVRTIWAWYMRDTIHQMKNIAEHEA